MGVDEHVPAVALVTGGRGFAARHLVEQLLRKTEYVVRIMDLSPELKLSEEEESGILGQSLKDGRAHYVQADLRDQAKVSEVVRGASTVFHMAAPDSSINKYQLHQDVTVTGTRNIVMECVKLRVEKLIYTSSPSVVFDGIGVIFNGDESMPIPKKHNDFYSEAKAQAEALVLSSNGTNGLLTCAIRPSGIFGPGDKLAVPSVIAGAKSGKLKFIIGDGENLFDWTYVENVANAHLCADNSLVAGDFEGENVASGKAYFITNGEPIRFWEFFILILEGLGYPSPKYCLPVKLLMPFAYLVQWAYNGLAAFGLPPPQFTPTRLRIISTTRTFNISRARKLIGYSPPVSLQEGISRTVKAFGHLRAGAPTGKGVDRSPSKIQLLLGDGTVADVVLWRDTRQTLTVISLLSFTFYFFLGSGYSLISVAATLAYLGILAVFMYNLLPESVFGTSVPRIPPVSSFEVSEESLERAALIARVVWNFVMEIVVQLQKGKNWSLFFQSLTILCFMNYIGRFSLQTQASLGLLMAFCLPYYYDQHEDKVDHFVASVLDKSDHYKSLVLSKLSGFRGKRN